MLYRDKHRICEKKKEQYQHLHKPTSILAILYLGACSYHEAGETSLTNFRGIYCILIRSVESSGHPRHPRQRRNQDLFLGKEGRELT